MSRRVRHPLQSTFPSKLVFNSSFFFKFGLHTNRCTGWHYQLHCWRWLVSLWHGLNPVIKSKTQRTCLPLFYCYKLYILFQKHDGVLYYAMYKECQTLIVTLRWKQDERVTFLHWNCNLLINHFFLFDFFKSKSFRIRITYLFLYI